MSRARRLRAACIAIAGLAVAGISSPLRAEPSAQAPAITVEGERQAPQAARKAPEVSASIITRERLEQPAMTAPEALRIAPGVQIVALGGFGAVATASLRGATAAQTPVYFAGVRLNDEVSGVGNLSDVPLAFVDRVEIYRSHPPLEASDLGIGGAILFEPKLPKTQELRLSLFAGSHGTRGATAHGSLKTPGGALLAGVETFDADNDYEIRSQNGTPHNPADDGYISQSNADAHSKSFWLHAEQRVGRARLRLLYQGVNREQGAPKLLLLPSRQARAVYGRDLVGLSTRIPLPDWGGSVEVRSSGVVAHTALTDPLEELFLTTKFIDTRGERLEQAVLMRQSTVSGVRFGQQVTLSEERLRRIEQDVNVLETALVAQRRSVRSALAGHLPLGDSVSANALVSLSCFGTAVSRAARCGNVALDGRVGLELRRKATHVYLNFSKSHRQPTLGELYGVSLFARGNPELVVERALTAELGGRYTLDRDGATLLWLDAAAFIRAETDGIRFERPAQGQNKPFNVGRSRTLGAELAAGVRPLRWLELNGSLSLLDPRNTSTERSEKNDVMTFKSRLRGNARLALRHDFSGGVLSRAALAGVLMHQASQFADRAGLQVIPSSTSLDLESELALFDDRLNLRLRVTNLLDALLFDMVGYVLPGRSVYFSAEARL